MTLNQLIDKLSVYENYGDKEVVIQNLNNASAACARGGKEQ